MNDDRWLAERFEANREQLSAVAFRMLGSLAEAEDAVQEAWLRLSRTGADGIDNLPAWLRTVTARVCLDVLRSRKARREEALEEQAPLRAVAAGGGASDPEREAVLADSVGLALLVVLETLAPAERLAFVLHDLFDVPFDEIAPIVQRTPDAARQLASRARRRVRGASRVRDPDRARKREVVDAFLAASRRGDFEALLSLLDPEVVLRMDARLVPAGAPTEIRGVEAVAKRSGRGGARAAQPALIDGTVGVVVAPRGRLMMVLRFTLSDEGKILAIEAVADPARLAALELAVDN